MLDSTWYKKELQEKLRNLKKMRDMVSLEERKVMDDTILTIEDNLRKRPTIILRNLDEILLYEYQKLIKDRELWSFFEDIADCNTDEELNLPDPEINLKDKEILELTHDFFKNATPSFIYEQFLKLFKQRKNIHFLKSCEPSIYANSLFLKYDQSFYVQIKRRNEFLDIPVLAHEFGHGIQFLANYQDSIFNHLSAYSEIISSFFEFICGYYYTFDPSLKNKAIISNYITWNTACNNAMILNQELQILKSIQIADFETKGDLHNKIKQFLLFANPEEIKKMLKNNPSQDFIYIFAYTITTQLFMIYLKDSDYAFYLLKRIMELNLNVSSEQYLDSLLELGLLPSSSVEDYDKHIKRELIRLK